MLIYNRIKINPVDSLSGVVHLKKVTSFYVLFFFFVRGASLMAIKTSKLSTRIHLIHC